MEEQEYRATYRALSRRHCIFEKSIHSRRCNCAQAARFNLADREGVACLSAPANARCVTLLDAMRSNARFSLHLTKVHEPLPHAKEIRVQLGGLLGLQRLLHPDRAAAGIVPDIDGLIREAVQQYRRIEKLPYDLIVQGITRFEGRRKRAHRRQ